MEEGAKGTVTSLASMFPADEAQKAAKRVQDTIAEKHQELDRVKGFIADNASLVNLVQKLPEELHHDIMVPFGKVAFFPGRLVHTNEFMVLLGEGYYAERTSKQTVEILRRRGKALETHVDSLKSMIEDLETEALFFDRTASDAAEGLVEIREELSGEESDEGASESGRKEDAHSVSVKDKGKVLNEDEEYARLMSKLEELEKEELAAEAADNIEEETNEVDPDVVSEQSSFNQNLKDWEGSHSCKPPSHSEEGQASDEEFLSRKRQQPALLEKSNPNDPTITSSHKDKSLKLPALEGNDHAGSSNNEVSIQPSKPKFDSLRAFTGSIIERSPNLPINPGETSSTSSQVPSSQSSKPQSRFRMQRR
ncbi:RNA polymerase II subunit 5-mediating protein homolog isoform X2 [Rhodamnia argentea]|uniref:RNA polymerase II subunit 5-mediating protein homolog isoform X2 n=1 Tax=Rhodamnia argentea TaxID=178133 RepID=A0A8B8QGV1_9MYRT|nr:RNA polymerase II subunit 5-mediating protein homolog isoform X2 [Rhodamnia argentea]